MTQLHLCISSWKTTRIFAISKLCKQRHQWRKKKKERERERKKKGNKSEGSQRILKRKSSTKEAAREERRMYIPCLCSGWHTAVHNVWVQNASQVEKRINSFTNTLCPAKHIPKLIMGKGWQLPLVRCPRILGASSRT